MVTERLVEVAQELQVLHPVMGEHRLPGDPQAGRQATGEGSFENEGVAIDCDNPVVFADGGTFLDDTGPVASRYQPLQNVIVEDR